MKKRGLFTGGITRFVEWLTEMSYVRLGTMYALMITGFGILYFLLGSYLPHHGPSIGGGPWFIRLFNGMYFSIITAASVGYGDISPNGLSKIFASLQSLLSLFIFAILVSKPVSERQERALYQMHKLTLDEIFTSIREGFFIMRKDFDAIIQEVTAKKKLSIHGVENFETALHQGQVLIEDIPTFYDTERKLYIIDVRREKLLAEAVERTFERLQKTLRIIKDHSVSLPVRTKNILEEVRRVGTETLKLWKKHSSKGSHGMIERSLEILQSIEG